MALTVQLDTSIGLSMIYIQNALRLLKKQRDKYANCGRCKQSEKDENAKTIAFLEAMYKQVVEKIDA